MQHPQSTHSTMKIFIYVACLVTAVSASYPGDIKMVRLGVVTSDFAGYLHQKTLQSDNNSVISPLSVHMIMTNAELGARGATLTEMNDVLQLTRFDGGEQKPHEAYTNLREQYSANTTDGKVLVVNGFYVKPTALVQKFFKATMTYYMPDLSAIDLTDPSSTEQKVNDLFKNKTGGLIQNIVKPGDFDSSSNIVLASAVTVATTWAKSFSSTKTKPGYFTVSAKNISTIDFLNDDYRDVKLKQNFHGADIIELPGHGNRYSLFFLLPAQTSSLAEQEASLTAVNRSKELFKGLSATRCRFSVPKMRIESTYELSSAFKALGMVKAFDPTQGDFTALSRAGGIYINKHLHKAVFEINENGTAAGPGVPFKPPGLLEFPGFQNCYINRPFLMFLRDNKYGVTLLQGKYTGK